MSDPKASYESATAPPSQSSSAAPYTTGNATAADANAPAATGGIDPALSSPVVYGYAESPSPPSSASDVAAPYTTGNATAADANAPAAPGGIDPALSSPVVYGYAESPSPPSSASDVAAPYTTGNATSADANSLVPGVGAHSDPTNSPLPDPVTGPGSMSASPPEAAPNAPPLASSPQGSQDMPKFWDHRLGTFIEPLPGTVPPIYNGPMIEPDRGGTPVYGTPQEFLRPEETLPEMMKGELPEMMEKEHFERIEVPEVIQGGFGLADPSGSPTYAEASNFSGSSSDGPGVNVPEHTYSDTDPGASSKYGSPDPSNSSISIPAVIAEFASYRLENRGESKREADAANPGAAGGYTNGPASPPSDDSIMHGGQYINVENLPMSEGAAPPLADPSDPGGSRPDSSGSDFEAARADLSDVGGSDSGVYGWDPGAGLSGSGDVGSEPNGSGQDSGSYGWDPTGSQPDPSGGTQI